MNAATLTLTSLLLTAPQGIFDDLAAEEAKRAPEASAAEAAPADEAADTKADAVNPDEAPAAPAPESAPATVKVPATPPTPAPATPAPSGPRWRILVAVGADHAQADNLDWVSEVLPATTHLRGERSLEAIIPGLSVYLGGELWNRGATVTATGLSLTSAEATAGILWHLPQGGLWGWVFPYGRAGLSAGYLAVRAGDSLGADVFVPGAQVAAGVRLHFGRVHAGRRVSFYGFGEGGYALRLTRTVRLAPVGVDEEDPVLPGPDVRLGRVDLSGAAYRFGIGIAF